MEQKQEDSAVVSPSSPSSGVDIVASKARDGEEEKKGEAVAAKDVGDDDGYQTPTSPRHRIPPAIECPPAPKKPWMRKRRQCVRIKAGTRRVRRRIIEIGSAVRRNSDDPSPTKKKAIIGDVTAHL